MRTWQPPPQSPGRGQLRPADLVLQKQHESIATPRSSVLWLKSEVPPGGLSGSKGESWALSEGWGGRKGHSPRDKGVGGVLAGGRACSDPAAGGTGALVLTLWGLGFPWWAAPPPLR